eukprot:CAMPEP_0181511238 /NCGR_PEP_ID=MMETSP1110-20121109/61320_1 /TAXON_ID=174948 /ORGANISM="Symbiodinium sp., Strain CCMP421" /LENGTH=120 /DNA_ID=CAMNT_0023640947 /DNA_START=99 /DNA_END=457 /DNA_ORIENTATION=-
MKQHLPGSFWRKITCPLSSVRNSELFASVWMMPGVVSSNLLKKSTDCSAPQARATSTNSASTLRKATALTTSSSQSSRHLTDALRGASDRRDTSPKTAPLSKAFTCGPKSESSRKQLKPS